ncbi:hypothetical protein KY290_018546 [Solanum tuberosum]|uniref:Uncharacterized protein n=1 Tax=Solanum tuberosum TaxID=4113 RepID=A0ABQ7VGN3_SOLTU|nr:hypothetical protein KY290_018546 [Solanum tuberosum]
MYGTGSGEPVLEPVAGRGGPTRIVVLPISAESAGLLPKRIARAKGSDIVLEDAVMSKITSASQLVDESGKSPTVDFSKIYMDEVGGVKKACIYGFGSQAVFYENIGSSSASTSQPQDCSFDAQ